MFLVCGGCKIATWGVIHPLMLILCLELSQVIKKSNVISSIFLQEILDSKLLLILI